MKNYLLLLLLNFIVISGFSQSDTSVMQTASSIFRPKSEKDGRWYVLRVVSGKERKIKEYLDKDIIRNGWSEIIKQIFLGFGIHDRLYIISQVKKLKFFLIKLGIYR